MTNDEHYRIKEDIYNTVMRYADRIHDDEAIMAMKSIGWDLYRSVDMLKIEMDASPQKEED